MKMAKASERDIEAAGNAMSVLDDLSSGYYPARDGEEDAPTFFDPDDQAHLRRFYDLVNATLDASPGWPGRVIGGMCYVIMYDKNEIIDPAADVIELHPKLKAGLEAVDRVALLEQENAKLRVALENVKLWFESERKSISKGNGSNWSMWQCEEQIATIDAAIQSAAKGGADQEGAA